MHVSDISCFSWKYVYINWRSCPPPSLSMHDMLQRPTMLMRAILAICRIDIYILHYTCHFIIHRCQISSSRKLANVDRSAKISAPAGRRNGREVKSGAAAFFENACDSRERNSAVQTRAMVTARLRLFINHASGKRRAERARVFPKKNKFRVIFAD